MPSNSTNEYGQLLNPQSYVAHGDVTNLGGNFLTKGSINVLIRKGPTEKTGKVITRGGTSLVGALKTVDNGITRSTDWDNSTGDKLSLRANFNSLTVFYNNQWQQIYSGFGGRCLLEFVPWYNAIEQRDTLLFALGDTKIREWSGGIATIASATINTLTKTGYATSTTYTFDAPTNTITDSSGSFASAAFAAGDNLVVSGSASNDGIYQISSIAGNVITIAQANALTTEAAGATVIIKWTKGGSWQDARFLTSATLGAKQVTINGVVFTYTGGETTGTLTGVTPDPTVSSPVVVAGNTAFQTVRVHTVSDNGGVRSDIKFDYVGVYTNYIFYGSKTSRVVLMSKSTDFTSCGFSTPRLPTEGAEIDLDSTPAQA